MYLLVYTNKTHSPSDHHWLFYNVYEQCICDLKINGRVFLQKYPGCQRVFARGLFFCSEDAIVNGKGAIGFRCSQSQLCYGKKNLLAPSFWMVKWALLQCIYLNLTFFFFLLLSCNSAASSLGAAGFRPPLPTVTQPSSSGWFRASASSFSLWTQEDECI